MAMKASADIIRQMKDQLGDTCADIDDANEIISNIKGGIDEWDDELADQFLDVLDDISSSTEEPKATLHAAQPKLERLAQAVDKYTSISFDK